MRTHSVTYLQNDEVAHPKEEEEGRRGEDRRPKLFPKPTERYGGNTTKQ